MKTDENASYTRKATVKSVSSLKSSPVILRGGGGKTALREKGDEGVKRRSVGEMETSEKSLVGRRHTRSPSTQRSRPPGEGGRTRKWKRKGVKKIKLWQGSGDKKLQEREKRGEKKRKHDAPRRKYGGSLTVWHTQGDSWRGNRLSCLKHRLTERAAVMSTLSFIHDDVKS